MSRGKGNVPGGKRVRKTGVSASLFSNSGVGALPRATVRVNGQKCQVMVDTGCTKTIVHVGRCTKWFRKSVAMTQMGGTDWKCQGTSKVRVAVGAGVEVEVRANVTSVKPFGFECVLGMDAIKKLKGVTVVDEATVRFGVQSEVCGGMVGPCDSVQDGGELQVDERDFHARFDPGTKCWTMAWKWRDEQEPEVLKNVRSKYAVWYSGFGKHRGIAYRWGFIRRTE